MLDTLFKKSSFADLDFKVKDISSTERVIYWSIVLTPLWWLLGIQTLYIPFLAVWLLLSKLEIDKLTKPTLPYCVWAWFGMAIAMVFTATLGLIDTGFRLVQVAATLVTFLKSYCLIFSCLAIPFWHRVRLEVVIRAVAWMSVGYGVVVFLQVVLFYAGIWDQSLYPPLARLIPGDKLSLLVKPIAIQPFFGIPLPRTSLYMPDPPILGVCGLLCFFVCIGEKHQRLRQLSVTGSLIALVVSQSRLAWVCFPVALLLTYCFRYASTRQASLASLSALSAASAIFGMTIKDLFDKSFEVFTSARAASSTDREFVVGKTIEAWLQSPWVGWGIIQGSVRWYKYNIALGSFSTYASVLYLHGLLGFTFFIIALGTTLWEFWRLAIIGNQLAQSAFASLVALYVLIQGLPLSWMCVYFWFFFIWLGAILRETGNVIPTVSKWEELRLKH